MGVALLFFCCNNESPSSFGNSFYNQNSGYDSDPDSGGGYGPPGDNRQGGRGFDQNRNFNTGRNKQMNRYNRNNNQNNRNNNQNGWKNGNNNNNNRNNNNNNRNNWKNNKDGDNNNRNNWKN